jgi:hypothetical protein
MSDNREQVVEQVANILSPWPDHVRVSPYERSMSIVKAQAILDAIGYDALIAVTEAAWAWMNPPDTWPEGEELVDRITRNTRETFIRGEALRSALSRIYPQIDPKETL